MATTHSRIKVDSDEGRKFLRRVVRENAKLSSSESWQVRANPGTQWKFEFSRRVLPKQIGDEEGLIVVSTDATVSLPRDKDTGDGVQSFADAKPVCVRRPTRLYLNGETWQVAKFLADGWRFSIVASAGSTSSSAHGLSFYYLYALDSEYGYYGIVLGGETVAVNGRAVIRCAVDID